MKRLARAGGALVVLLVLFASFDGWTKATESRAPRPPRVFPVMLYCVEESDAFPETAAAGFNLVQGYRFEGGYPDRYANTQAAARAYLDAAERSGLRVLMGLAVNLQERTMREDLEHIRERVQMLKDHRALFGWQLYDEPDRPIYHPRTGKEMGGRVSPKNLKVAYDTIKRLDPDHPVSVATVLTIEDTPRAPYPYRLGADIFMPGYFPIPYDTIETIRAPIKSAVDALMPRGKAVWPHIQVYDQARDTPDGAPRRSRYPTRDEIRFMSYYAVILGADGLSFNCYWFDYGPGRGADDISRKANPRQWDAVMSVALELKAVNPILVAPTEKPEQAGITVSDVDPVTILIKRYQGRSYILTANPSPTPVQRKIRLAPTRFPNPEVRLVPDGETLAVRAHTVTVRWGPYDVRIYEVLSGTPRGGMSDAPMSGAR